MAGPTIAFQRGKKKMPSMTIMIIAHNEDGEEFHLRTTTKEHWIPVNFPKNLKFKIAGLDELIIITDDWTYKYVPK